MAFAGYGEMLLENFAAENESGARNAPTTRLDFLRAILYAGYRFNDRFLFNSEIEVEHGNEIFVEFAYLDYMVNDNLSLRGGMLLLPLGLVNEFHEPTVFIGSKRPETEQRILPTTWRENGAGVLGSFGRVNFRAYIVNGLNGALFTSAGLRPGRQKGANARAANMAFAGRLDVTPLSGVFAGVGLYHGGSGQDAVVLGGERLDVGTTIAEVHGFCIAGGTMLAMACDQIVMAPDAKLGSAGAEVFVAARRRGEAMASPLAAQRLLRQARVGRYVRGTGFVTVPNRILLVSRGWIEGEPLTHEIQAVLEVSELYRPEGPTLRVVSWTDRDR